MARSGLAPDETVKLDELVALPPSPWTVIAPDVVAGTVAAICVGEVMVYDATVPLKVTLVTVSRLVPVMVTAVPEVPLAGEKLIELGAGDA